MKHEKLGTAAKKSTVDVVIGIKPIAKDEKNDERVQANALAEKLREQGIKTEVFYKDDESLGKQAQFAEKRQASVLIINTDPEKEMFDVNNLDGTTVNIAGFEALIKTIFSKIKAD